MKTQKEVQDNFDQKLALWKINFNRSGRLKEHIRMLDWVLDKSKKIRTIEEIEAEA